MAAFSLSAFADEASPFIDDQLEALKTMEITKIELRGVDNRSSADLTSEEAKALSKKLSKNGISLSALGSPYGKIGIEDDFEPHLEKFKNSLEVCKILNTDKIRMFSFYLPKDGEPAQYRDKVFERLEKMVELSRRAGIKLCHENEKGIFGDNDTRCLELYSHFHGELGLVFDPANFIQCGVNPLKAYGFLKEYITYFHMKDALFSDGSVVSVGNGDGSVKTILSDYNKYTDREVILTVEPHLAVFKGLEELQGEKLKNHESYPDSKTAFFAACNAVKKTVAEL